MRKILCAVSLLSTLIGCGTSDVTESREPWSWAKLESKRLKSFDEWRAGAGVTLTPEQEASLQQKGELYNVVPSSELPVRHRNGTIEVAPEAHDALAKTNGMNSLDRFEARWRLGLFDPKDPVQVDNAQEFLAARNGVSRQAEGYPGYDPPPACKSSCSVEVSVPSVPESSNVCECSEGYFWDQPTDTKPAIQKTATLTVTCAWTSDCSNDVQTTVVGPALAGVADCAGSATIDSAQYGASWSGGAAFQLSQTGMDPANFNQSLSFLIGSKVEGSERRGSSSQMSGSASGGASANGYGANVNLVGSSEVDASVSRKSATTWLYGPTDLTSAHSLNFTFQSLNFFGLNRNNASKTVSMTGTAGSCSCSIVPGTFTSNAARVVDHVSLQKNTDAASCSCTECSGLDACTVTGG